MAEQEVQEPVGRKPEINSYDHSDSDFDPELDGVSASPPAVKPAGKSAPSPSQPEAVPSAPPPKPRRHPRGLRLRALELGATEEDIDATSTSALDDWVYEQNRLLETERERAQRETSTANLVDARRRQANAEPPAEPQDDLGLGDLEKELDPRFAGLLRRLTKENQELKQSVTATAEREQQRQRRTTEEIYDSAFESLGAKYEKVFGKGDGGSIKGTKHMQRRIAVLSAAGLDVTNDSAQVMKRKINSAVEALYGDLATEVGDGGKSEADDAGAYGRGAPLSSAKGKPLANGNGKPRISQEDWDNGTLAKPTHRTSKEPRGVAKATRAVSEKMRELQITDEDFDFEEDGLPE